MAEETVMQNYIEAINSALKEEMRRDERVIIFGEDLISMHGASNETVGIFEEFGPDRIKDTPITEEAIVGMAYGAAMTGLRPIGVLMFASLALCAGDQLWLKVGANRQEWGYYGPLPLVIHGMIFGGVGIGQDHATSPEALLMHCPGLKVVLPSNAYDGKGLMKAAIRDDEPVVFMPHRGLFFGAKEAIPVEDYIIPLGKADVKKEGTDVTIVSYSAMVIKALEAARELEKQGISAEVVDLRSIVPLDIDAVVNSVKKTGRLLIVHEAMKRGGVAAEVGFRFIEAAPDVMKTMKTPMRRLAAKNVGLLRSQQVEPLLLPQVQDIISTVKEMV